MRDRPVGEREGERSPAHHCGECVCVCVCVCVHVCVCVCVWGGDREGGVGERERCLWAFVFPNAYLENKLSIY